MKVDLNLRCHGCKKLWAFQSLRQRGRSTCPDCQAGVWDLALKFFDPGEAKIALGWTALGVGLAVVTEGKHGFIVYNVRDSKLVVMRETDVPASMLEQLFPHPWEQVLRAIMGFLARSEKRREEFSGKALPGHGVHCMACQIYFVPASIFRQYKVGRGASTADDAFCSARCRGEYQWEMGARPCKLCDKEFRPPSLRNVENALAEKSEDKAWHSAGYCCQRCYQNRDNKRTCPSCAKVFLIPVPSRLAKRKTGPKRWHSAGYCSKRCLENPEPAAAASPESGAPSKDARLMGLRCGCGQGLSIPKKHSGFYFVCPRCKKRLMIKASAET